VHGEPVTSEASTWYFENNSDTTNTSSFESQLETWLCQGNSVFDVWNIESNTFQVSIVCRMLPPISCFLGPQSTMSGHVPTMLVSGLCRPHTRAHTQKHCKNTHSLMHARAHHTTHTHTRTDTRTDTNRHTNIHTQSHTHTRARIHKCKHGYTHTQSHTRTHTRPPTPSSTHTRKHTNTHTQTHDFSLKRTLPFSLSNTHIRTA